MTIAILIHKSVNCKCESMKSMNRDDEGRGRGRAEGALRPFDKLRADGVKDEIAALRSQ